MLLSDISANQTDIYSTIKGYDHMNNGTFPQRCESDQFDNDIRDMLESYTAGSTKYVRYYLDGSTPPDTSVYDNFQSHFSAMEKLVKREGNYPIWNNQNPVYRGENYISLNEALKNNIIQDAVSGKTQTISKTFMSTSESIYKAKGFGNVDYTQKSTNGSVSVFYEIESQLGIPVNGISAFYHEHEILILPYTKFEIKKVEVDCQHNIIKITLRESGIQIEIPKFKISVNGGYLNQKTNKKQETKSVIKTKIVKVHNDKVNNSPFASGNYTKIPVFTISIKG